MLATWSTAQILLTTIELVSTTVMVTVAAAAAPAADRWPGLLVIIAAGVAMIAPDTEAGLVALLGYGGWWLSADRAASWVAVLVAAVASLTLHLALAYAAAAPPGAAIRGNAVRRQLIDVGLVLVGTGVTALTLAVLRGTGFHAPAFTIGVALLLLALLSWIAPMRGDSP